MAKKLKSWLVIALIILCFGCGGSTTAFAATPTYTGVLDDLQIAENFDPADYPKDENDASLKVIQVAESSDGELFIYVYQPAGKYIATNINISTAINESLSYKHYSLLYCNRSLDYGGVFFKYKVNDFEVKKDALRYYDISSIFRAWDESVDKGSGNDNTINGVSYEVGQLWTAATVNGEVSYHLTDTETILVTDKYVDFLQYSDGFKFFPGVDKCNSHYVAFSTDKPMDKLLEADVSWVERSYSIYRAVFGLNPQKSTGSSTSRSETLTYTDKASNPADGLFATRYTWDRIESVSDFVKNEDLTDDAKANVEKKQWVLRFTETKYTLEEDINLGSSWEIGTEVSEVTILRLKFETDGVVYNLGVVDNKQTGDDIPGNNQNPGDFFSWLLSQWWFWVIVALLLFAILSPFIPFFALLLKGIFKVIWFIISAPFRFIAWLFKRRKDE